MNILVFVLIAIAGYLFGSISFALIIGKLMYNTDVREKGSKSAGATNVLRTLGKKAAILVTIGDVSKGIIAFLIGSYIGKFAGNSELGAVIGGFCAILGHNFPLYFNFKGGKGVLTSLALVLMLNWQSSVIALIVFVIVLVIFRYVSLASLTATFTNVVLLCVFMWDKPVYCVAAILAGAMIFIKHKSNIKRLLAKEESKIF